MSIVNFVKTVKILRISIEVNILNFSSFPGSYTPHKSGHLRMYDKLPMGLAQCKVCGKTVTNMRNHYLSHFPENHQCDVCFKFFSRSDSLKLHYRRKHLN